jgi:phage FluMu gp28-like protein
VIASENIVKDFDAARHIDGVLLPYQQAWIADTADVKVYEKSRRVGISWAEAADDALYSASEDGDDTWYIGYTKDMAREFIDDAAFWSRHYMLAAEAVEEIVFVDQEEGHEDRNILAYRINYASGHKIVALSSSPRNLRGKQGRVVIDEEAFHQYAKQLRKAAIALLMWGGKIRIISTHNGDANDFNEMINDIRAGKVPYSLHRTTLDDALADGLYKRICLVLKREWSPEAEAVWRSDLIAFYGDDANEELLCIPSQGSGVFMSRILIESCMKADIPVVRKAFEDLFVHQPAIVREAEVEAWCEDYLKPLLDKLDTKRAHYFGEDFGRSGDLTCIWPGAETQALGIRMPFALELRNCPFEQQRQILFYIVDRLPNFRHGCLDARGNGQFLAEVAMQKYGEYRITQVMLSTEWYRDNMPRYKAAYEDKTIEIPTDADILEDHRMVKMDKGVAKIPEERTTGADKGKRHGDSAVAGAMLWCATRTDGPPAASVGSETTKNDYHAERKSGFRGQGPESRGILGRLFGRGRA